MSINRRGDYGFDAPLIPALMGAGGVINLVGTVFVAAGRDLIPAMALA